MFIDWPKEYDERPRRLPVWPLVMAVLMFVTAAVLAIVE